MILNTKITIRSTFFSGCLLFLVSACNSSNTVNHNYRTTQETPVHQIALAPPLDNRHAEISGMAWCDEDLLLLPQFPDFAKRLNRLDKKNLSGLETFIYRIKKQQLDDYFNNVIATITPEPITFIENNVRKKVEQFDGFEAIACIDNQMWLTIENSPRAPIFHSYAIQATADLDSPAPSITLLTSSLKKIDSQTNTTNIGEEALLIDKERIITFHELNQHKSASAKLNWVNVINSDRGTIPFVNLPYRLTDVTRLDNDNRFWGINYHYKNDHHFKKNNLDYIFEKFGKGITHQNNQNIERLIEFELTSSGVVLTNTPPIQLQLIDKGRNWEGITRYGNHGLLIITDKFPSTIFAYVPFNNQPNITNNH